MLLSIQPEFQGTGTYSESNDCTMTYLGVGSSVNDQPDDIATSTLCPKWGDRDPHNFGAHINSVRISRLVTEDKAPYWRIITESSSDIDLETDPTREPAEIVWNSQQYEGLTIVDRNNKYLLNTAKDVVAVPKENSRWTIAVQKNMKRVPKYLLDFNNYVNRGSFTIDGVTFKKGKLMCKGMTVSKKIRQKTARRTFVYRTVSYQLHYRAEGWNVKHPNVGLNEIVKIDTIIRNDAGVAVLNSDGEMQFEKQEVKRRIMIGEPREPTLDPVPLRRNGSAIQDPNPSDIHDLDFEVYGIRNFGALPTR